MAGQSLERFKKKIFFSHFFSKKFFFRFELELEKNLNLNLKKLRHASCDVRPYDVIAYDVIPYDVGGVEFSRILLKCTIETIAKTSSIEVYKSFISFCSCWNAISSKLDISCDLCIYIVINNTTKHLPSQTINKSHITVNNRQNIAMPAPFYFKSVHVTQRVPTKKAYVLTWQRPDKNVYYIFILAGHAD